MEFALDAHFLITLIYPNVRCVIARKTFILLEVLPRVELRDPRLLFIILRQEMEQLEVIMSLGKATSVNDNDLLLSSLQYHSASLANIASQIQSNQTRHRPQS